MNYYFNENNYKLIKIFCNNKLLLEIINKTLMSG